jgi:predicted component of type VI protein secretion system
MIKCPSCSHENVDGTTFCEMCGEELQAASVASNGGASTPAADAGASSGDIKCPACENLNPRDNVVCEVCGTELHPAAAGDTSAVSVPAPTPTSAPSSDAVSTPAVDAAAPQPDVPPADTPNVDAPAVEAAAPSTPATATLDSAAGTAATPVADTTADAPDAVSTPAVALRPGMAKLVVEQGMSVGKQFVLGDAEMQIGREDEEEDIYPDIDLADQDEGYVHRRHATLKFQNDSLSVTHLGGANKTRVNNKPIPDNTPQAVKLGDKIAFGKVVLRLLPL